VATGKVKFVYKYFPVLDGQNIGESHWAAYAAECANDQGKFWEFHDDLFNRWLGENVGMYEKDMLKRFARQMKLDTVKFNECLDSDKYAQVVQADVAEGTQLQVRGTPAFFLNGTQMQLRSLNYEEFAATIDQALTSAK
jgi:protein-disulfide isomerase